VQKLDAALGSQNILLWLPSIAPTQPALAGSMQGNQKFIALNRCVDEFLHNLDPSWPLSRPNVAPKAVTRCAIARDRWHNVHGGAITASSVGSRRR
jgi:hypothetical protein